MTRRLILLRHGQTNYNATSRMQGQLDTELSDLGFAQADSAAALLVKSNITHIFSSDLSRAYNTAQAVAKLIDAEVGVDKRLRETHLGEWQAKTHTEVDEEYPGARAQWRHDPQWAPPGGESRVEVARRARQFVDELMVSLPDWDQGTVLIVAHGGTINALTSNLLDLEYSQYPMFSGLGNTCWAQLTARPRYYAGSENPEDDLKNSGAVSASPHFDGTNVENAQWYLDCWNMGVSR
ncbi:fructose-2,6-bisphosphatase [Corynebacterium deserti GIMN1.010]|uniref:Fructose-2,6-bisphosphatase n=1 Tax=Corynebacterium deserti GIMN1.010 TaxID=931089 RepID=A0A0M4CKK7_9CORY|nr:histidine phosphatase family protein [Corynebacterium deserti]ALC06514.1 fructose-2,6-bisphosphatase [Corynebacterium deserti GIMN1.010]